jgi:GNAT superfamily N-acetyltransferase
MAARYNIRLANEGDLPHLPKIEERTAQLFAPFGLDELFRPDANRLDEMRPYFDANRIWVAEADGTPIGFAMAKVVDENAHLEEVDVLPEYGRQGIGSALIETVCQWAISQKFLAITLSTQKNIPWNMPYYEKLGFVIIPQDKLTPAYQKLRAHERELGLPVDDRLIMKKMLAAS